ncbi:DHH family phosphoesterase [Cyclobacterium amurskyense]|uniref:3'-to-5' oligoribonuclease A n=1 Tax=Cyclobacterium amurskyense TaxID=320787 RepID=A0A0H4PK36_9BACT|nr:bifunctional oligoribonuclease/PAP phosphatase NrnA [Cyclobacterium amurskyense]AKP53333.1 3'-to-5' oligoribonuclease A [Cyclobacterium amurskyense]|tara:strand:- start:473 stop:1477 length:1005 start_codon:yes stop_codon:yes gene_type:complete
MNVYEQIVAEIKTASNIIITSHKSPDGDSVGSSLGLLHFIEKLGKTATVCHPDPAPSFLDWLDTSSFLIMTEQGEAVEAAFATADLVFCLDYNGTNRVGYDMQVLLEGLTCKTIMIDHHLAPEDFPTITLSETSVSSTAELIVELIEQSGNINLLDQKIGTPLYLGILTDTGSFRFPSTSPRTHEILAKLLTAGVAHHLVHELLSDNNTESRLRLQGYAMCEKLEVMEDYMVAIISLSKEELAKYNYQKGDTDSLANQALSIKGMKAAIVFTERDGIMKISFRSKGQENPVNVLAAENFNGGGHANASGGMSELSVTETLAKIKDLVPKYFSAN